MRVTVLEGMLLLLLLVEVLVLVVRRRALTIFKLCVTDARAWFDEASYR